MKKSCIPFCLAFIIFSGCQKSFTAKDDADTPESVDSSVIPNIGITYEVVTTDTSGWAGIWNGAKCGRGSPPGSVVKNG